MKGKNGFWDDHWGGRESVPFAFIIRDRRGRTKAGPERDRFALISKYVTKRMSGMSLTGYEVQCIWNIFEKNGWKIEKHNDRSTDSST